MAVHPPEGSYLPRLRTDPDLHQLPQGFVFHHLPDQGQLVPHGGQVASDQVPVGTGIRAVDMAQLGPDATTPGRFKVALDVIDNVHTQVREEGQVARRGNAGQVEEPPGSSSRTPNPGRLLP